MKRGKVKIDEHSMKEEATDNLTEEKTISDQPTDNSAEKETQPAAENGNKEETQEEKKIDTEALIAEWKDKYLRLSAEFDNYRRRTLKEKMELTKFAGEQMIKDLLPVIDDFERGMQHLDQAQDLEAFKQGIVLIYNKFNDFLQQKGLKEIAALNAEFSTDFHEAITKVPVQDESMKGKIIDVVQKGYLMDDKVVRYSKVVIGE